MKTAKLKYKFIDFPVTYTVTKDGETDKFKTLEGIVSFYDEFEMDDLFVLYQYVNKLDGEMEFTDKLAGFEINKHVNKAKAEVRESPIKRTFNDMQDFNLFLDTMVKRLEEKYVVEDRRDANDAKTDGYLVATISNNYYQQLLDDPNTETIFAELVVV